MGVGVDIGEFGQHLPGAVGGTRFCPAVACLLDFAVSPLESDAATHPCDWVDHDPESSHRPRYDRGQQKRTGTPYYDHLPASYMTVLNATQVGVGAGPVNIAAAVVLLGGIVLAALWVRSLTA